MNVSKTFGRIQTLGWENIFQSARSLGKSISNGMAALSSFMWCMHHHTGENPNIKRGFPATSRSYDDWRIGMKTVVPQVPKQECCVWNGSPAEVKQSISAQGSSAALRNRPSAGSPYRARALGLAVSPVWRRKTRRARALRAGSPPLYPRQSTAVRGAKS